MVAKQLGIPVIIGDAALEETLVEASVGSCRALVVVSTDDVTNLQAALNGRALQADLRVVLRLFDGDLAQRIRSTFGIFRSHSVSYLAAPAFAAVLRKRQVVATIPVGRHALLVTIVVVAKGSALAGQPVRAADQTRGVRVMALLQAGQRPRWSPAPDTVLGPGDELTVIARRAGLSWLIKQATPPPAVPTQPGPGDQPGTGATRPSTTAAPRAPQTELGLQGGHFDAEHRLLVGPVHQHVGQVGLHRGGQADVTAGLLGAAPLCSIIWVKSSGGSSLRRSSAGTARTTGSKTSVSQRCAACCSSVRSLSARYASRSLSSARAWFSSASSPVSRSSRRVW